MTQTLEHVTFRLVPGTEPGRFLALAQATEAVVRRQPGFVARWLSAGDDGTWHDLVLWASPEAAQAAAQAVMAEPAFAPFAEAIDMASLEMRHESLRWGIAA